VFASRRKFFEQEIENANPQPSAKPAMVFQRPRGGECYLFITLVAESYFCMLSRGRFFIGVLRLASLLLI